MNILVVRRGGVIPGEYLSSGIPPLRTEPKAGLSVQCYRHLAPYGVKPRGSPRAIARVNPPPNKPGSSMSLHTALLIASFLLLLIAGDAGGQTPGTAKEFWPKFTATVELAPKTRIQLWGQRQDGEDFDFEEWKVGALVSHRMKQIVKPHRRDIDEENEHTLVLGAGYEYLQTDQNDQTRREHRIILQSTPRYLHDTGVLLQDRNRVELRWVAGNFSARYRNKLALQRGFKVDKVRFTPYASGELFYDGNHHSWNQNQYAFGVQLPYKKRLMLDAYYLRQNCTTCSQDPLNVFGVTLNLYFRGKK